MSIIQRTNQRNQGMTIHGMIERRAVTHQVKSEKQMQELLVRDSREVLVASVIGTVVLMLLSVTLLASIVAIVAIFSFMVMRGAKQELKESNQRLTEL